MTPQQEKHTTFELRIVFLSQLAPPHRSSPFLSIIQEALKRPRLHERLRAALHIKVLTALSADPFRFQCRPPAGLIHYT